jgi:hypothetical protein
VWIGVGSVLLAAGATVVWLDEPAPSYRVVVPAP